MNRPILRSPSRRRLFAAFLPLLLLTACGGQASGGEARLLEFPGLHWNAPPEEVMGTLGLTEEQLETAQLTTGGPDIQGWMVQARDVPCFGAPATVTFQFEQFLGEGLENQLGLNQIYLDFPEDTDMAAVLAEMTELYGAGSQLKPEDYALRDGAVVQEPFTQKGTTSFSFNGKTRTYDLSPNEHTLYWGVRGRFLLPDDAANQAAAYFSSPAGSPVTEEAAEQWLDLTTLAQVSWSDAKVLRDGSLLRNNRVILNGRMLVYILQISGAGASY